MKSIKNCLIAFAMILAYSCGSNSNNTNLLSALIGDWSNKINNIIQNAQNAGLILEVTAASQAKNLIEQLRLTYEGELDKSVDAFSEKEQKIFDDITKSISGLEKGVTEAITNLSNVISMLPGINRTPQIRECTGNIIAPNRKDYILTLQGGFWDVAAENYKVSLKVNGQIINPIVEQTNQIEFQLPKSLFTTPSNKISYIPCEIYIDYKKSKLLLFHNKETATFSQKLIVLPPKFGEVILETTTLRDSTFVKPNQSCGPLTWSSKDGNNHNEILGCDIEPGWTCDVNTVTEQAAGEEGRINVDWFDLGNKSSLTRGQWQILTTPKSGLNGRDGVRSIILHYTIYQTRKVDVTERQNPVTLDWGNKIVLNIPRGAVWKLIFRKYNGDTLEIASTEQNSTLIKLDNIRDRQISLQVAPFNSL
jgi:hypothetical protein